MLPPVRLPILIAVISRAVICRHSKDTALPEILPGAIINKLLLRGRNSIRLESILASSIEQDEKELLVSDLKTTSNRVWGRWNRR